LPQPSAYTFVRREGGIAFTSARPAGAMDEVDIISDELAFDRGELSQLGACSRSSRARSIVSF
jgi:hypothetical protein